MVGAGPPAMRMRPDRRSDLDPVSGETQARGPAFGQSGQTTPVGRSRLPRDGQWRPMRNRDVQSEQQINKSSNAVTLEPLNLLASVVGDTGIEPVTPTVSR